MNSSVAGGLPGTSNESVRVVVRCRPLTEKERNEGHRSIVIADPVRATVELTNPRDSPDQPQRHFAFDAVYDASSKQTDLYDEVFRELVNSVLQGFNGTILAYGQTGTGKTYTMEGVHGVNDGIITQAIDHIFRHINDSSSECQFLVRTSYLEIYQEEIRDLLAESSSGKRLEIKERPHTGVYVNGLSSHVAKSAHEIEKVLKIGHRNRSVGETNMNEHSSRSHAILIITVECADRQSFENATHIRVGHLNLVDLAGSERQSKTGSEGERFREATRINLSLSALGNVISSLSETSADGKRVGHIPYRDSKLTRFLKDSLGGNAKTVMVACIGPASYNYDETLSTLRYAQRAKLIQNRPKVNEDPKDALLRGFQEEIIRLKNLLETRSGDGHGATGANEDRRRGARRQRKPQRKPFTDAAHEESGDDQMFEESRTIQERQLSLQLEREQLLRNTELIEEEKMLLKEKRRILAGLEDRAKCLDAERNAQLEIASRIAQMQSKLLTGHGGAAGAANLLDRTRRQQELIQRRRIELAAQRRREREIARQVEAQEDSTAEIRQTFANLQQEVDAKQQKLHRLVLQLQQNRTELQDFQEANSVERQALEESVLELNKELKLRWLIVQNFVPIGVTERIKKEALYDEDQKLWMLHNNQTEAQLVASAGHDSELAVAQAEGAAVDAEAEQALTDSGVAGSSLGSSGGFLSGFSAAAQFKPAVRSAVSIYPETRRPCTELELTQLGCVRQRYARLQRRKSLPTLSMAPDCFIPEENLRFGNENLIIWQNLSHCSMDVRRTSDEDRPSSSSTGRAEKVVVDISRIPMPTKRRNSGRDGSVPFRATQSSSTHPSLSRTNFTPRRQSFSKACSSSPLASSQSKNSYGRSVFGTDSLSYPLQLESRPPSASGGRIPVPISMPSNLSRTHQTPKSSVVVFPKARGLVSKSSLHSTQGVAKERRLLNEIIAKFRFDLDQYNKSLREVSSNLKLTLHNAKVSSLRCSTIEEDNDDPTRTRIRTDVSQIRSSPQKDLTRNRKRLAIKLKKINFSPTFNEKICKSCLECILSLFPSAALSTHPSRGSSIGVFYDDVAQGPKANKKIVIPKTPQKMTQFHLSGMNIASAAPTALNCTIGVLSISLMFPLLELLNWAIWLSVSLML